jgi:hypothetical protein
MILNVRLHPLSSAKIAIGLKFPDLFRVRFTLFLDKWIASGLRIHLFFDSIERGFPPPNTIGRGRRQNCTERGNICYEFRSHRDS